MDFDALLVALRLAGEPKRVLIVEDDMSWLHALSQDMQARSHRVTAGIGASPAGPGKILLQGEDPGVHDLADFDVAFLDHYFPGDHDGRTLTLQLRQASATVRILAMSSSSAANEAMVKWGADLGMVKSTLRRTFAKSEPLSPLGEKGRDEGPGRRH